MDNNTSEMAFVRNLINNIMTLKALSSELLDEAVSQSTVERLPPGRNIFRKGDDDNRSVFLLSGQVALVSTGQPTITIKGGEDSASSAVSDSHPREVTAVATTSVTLLSIDRDVLDNIVSQNNKTPDYSPAISHNDNNENLSNGISWLINSHMVRHLETTVINELKNSFIEIPVKNGEVIISEGDPPDFYHILVEGCCKVTRKSSSGREKLVAYLRKGCALGEKTVLLKHIHEHTFTMEEDGLLMRLTRDGLLNLLVNAFTKTITVDETLSMQNDGAVIIDIRTPSEYLKNNFIGSINLPLPMLWESATIFEADKIYIVCGDSQNLKTIAAFLLARNGLKVYVMQKSMRYVPNKKLHLSLARPHYR